ncbi:hypothetical protein [Paraburkholderia tropica]|uniref:hypothetical protein n=1 Tax=Paraburkholderia tropica TaxID=92647 RepID=UPI0015909FFE|nr:hypothetical protein [Paraburkholderia tropica]
MVKRDYSLRNQKLRERRQGSLGSPALEGRFGQVLASDSQSLTEAYERRAQSDSLKYALGAMQEVAEKYTTVSHKEKDRVTNQINGGMMRYGQSVDVQLQGSLALNIHLRRYSDVDLLVFPGDFLLYDSTGSAAYTYAPSDRDKVQVVRTLRTNCYTILKDAFPEVDVDDSGAKCINLTGGSLARSVDVVPALWLDTADYQTSRRQADRGVQILDRPKLELTGNSPFLYMENVNLKDHATMGGAKKAIRLLKTLKYDAEDEINFSSFDIASLVWNMSDAALSYPSYLETALLSSLQDEVNRLCENRAVADTLLVADKTRKIVRSDKDFKALQALNQELSDLIESIATELKPNQMPTFAMAKSALREARVE